MPKNLKQENQKGFLRRCWEWKLFRGKFQLKKLKLTMNYNIRTIYFITLICGAVVVWFPYVYPRLLYNIPYVGVYGKCRPRSSPTGGALGWVERGVRTQMMMAHKTHTHTFKHTLSHTQIQTHGISLTHTLTLSNTHYSLTAVSLTLPNTNCWGNMA